VAEALLDRDRGAAHVTEVERRRHGEQLPDRLCEPGRVVGRLGRLERDAAEVRRQRSAAVAVSVLGLETLVKVLGGLAVAVVLEHAREQLLRGLHRLEVEALLLVGGEHEPRLQLQERGDQDEELGGRLEVELAGALEELDVGEHDLRQIDLEEVDLLLQDQRQKEVERPVEDLEVKVERGDGHRRRE
jgi:hypothetical protein